jgi:hypothetical protein
MSGSPPIAWHDFELAHFSPFGDGAGAHFDATFDYDTQLFQWDTSRSSLGYYFWSVQATNEFGTDTGTLFVFLIIPEPSSATLVVLGLIGLTGFRRRR